MRRLLLAVFLLAPAAFAQQPVVKFTQAVYTVPEAAYDAYVHLVRTGDTSGTTQYSLTITNTSTGQQFVRASAFFKGQTDDTFFVNMDGPLVDNIWNPNRKYLLSFASISGGVAGSPSTTEVDVVDDDPPPHLLIGDISVVEGTQSLGVQPKQVSFLVRIGTAFPIGVIVPVTFHDGYAKNGVDYRGQTNNIFFAAGQTSTTITVEIIQDNMPEGDETFSVDVGPLAPGFGLFDTVTATCTILDDDGAVSPTDQRVAKGSKGVIHINLGDPAVTGETIQLLNTSQILTSPAQVGLAPGASSIDIEVGTTGTGTDTITVVLPPSRGGRSFPCNFTVYDPVAVTLDPVVTNVPIGGTANVHVTIDPKPAAPVTLSLTQTAPNIADIPSSVVVDGTGNIPVHAGAAGATTVTAKLPDPFGDITGKSSIDFVVVVNVPAGLAITSLSQKTGRAAGGDNVTLFANNMNGRCSVTFGGAPSQTTDLPSGGSLAVVTPPHDPGVVDVGIHCGADAFLLAGAFTYTAAPLTATTLTPTSGSTRGGTLVQLRGTNLRTGLCVARFAGTAAHAVAWGGTTSITVAAPAHAAGNVPVTLTCGSETVALAGGFNYFDGNDVAATITAATPLRVAPGDRVQLTGTRFRADDALFFDTTQIADAAPLASATARVVVIPELAAGSVQISLHDAAGHIVTGPKIDIAAATTPTITDMPAHITAGAEFTVSGTGLRKALTFALGPAVLQPLSLSTTRAVFRASSSLAAGPASFTISDHGAAAATRLVDITTAGLDVTSIAPPCSLREGGALATLSGSGFQSGAMVQFGVAYAPDVVVRNAFTLLARIPPAYGGGSDAVVTVTNPDGTTTTLTGAFAYRSAAEGGCAPARHRGAGH